MTSGRPSGAGIGYLDGLSEADLELVAAAAGLAARPERLRAEPGLVERLLADEGVARAVLGGAEAPEPELSRASPFLLFAVAVERVAADLREATYVQEWVGPRQRLPVLGADDLRELLADAGRRAFLAALLASYTRVASGTVWRRTPRGPRRQRFSELDPARLAALLDELPESRHAAVHRRLGDLALFLTGVFPDHAAGRIFNPIDLDRLGRAAAAGGGDPGLVAALETRGGVGLLEELGARWYRLAARAAPPPAGPLLDSVAARFGEARRALNVLTDRHLFPVREGLFPTP